MSKHSNAVCLCPLEGVIDTISKKWALLIINEIGNHGHLRYNDIMKELESISPKTLADMLKNLHKEDLIIRKAFNEIPPRVEYSLTEEGLEVHQSIVPLLQWAASRKDAVVRECSCKAMKLNGSK